MKVGLSYNAFLGLFKNIFSDVEVITDFLDLKEYNLIIFPGGSDINPSLYNEQNRFSYYNEDRDRIEREIFFSAISANKKILGICRGHQLINVLLGGSLYQDLQADLKKPHPAYHSVGYLFPDENSFIQKIFKGVNSLHHQGIKRLGRNLNATLSHNGIIEAFEGKNIIGVQFHPEMMNDKQSELFWEGIHEWGKKKTDRMKGKIFSGIDISKSIDADFSASYNTTTDSSTFRIRFAGDPNDH